MPDQTHRVDRFGNPWFVVGDIVTRDGTDLHKVTETNALPDCAPDLITVVCLKEPSSGWAKIGDVASNIASRYDLVDLSVVDPSLLV